MCGSHVKNVRSAITPPQEWMVKETPLIIDFGKSCQIAKARLRKPKLDVGKAIAHCPLIAPEIHRGEKQMTSSHVYSFGAMVAHALKDGKFEIPVLKQASRKCLSSNPAKRPKLEELLQKIAILILYSRLPETSRIVALNFLIYSLLAIYILKSRGIRQQTFVTVNSKFLSLNI